MAKFMDVHSGFFGVTAQQLAEAHQRDLDIEKDEGVHYEHAWLDPEAGKVFCLATGPSKEAVMRVHERAGHPTPEVYEVRAIAPVVAVAAAAESATGGAGLALTLRAADGTDLDAGSPTAGGPGRA